MKLTVRSHRLAVVAILAVALGLRLAAAVWWEQRQAQGAKFAFGDSHSYWILADHLASGEAYEYGPGQSLAFRTPGYPLLLAGMFVLYGGEPPVLWARALGAVLGTLAVGGVIWLTEQRFEARAALLAGGLAAIYPGAVGMSVLVLSEAPFCPLMLLQLGCWTEAARSASTPRASGWALAGGAAAGLATLVRPSWILFTALAALPAVVDSSARRRHLAIAAAMLAGLVLVMSPWWVRNYMVYGRFVPTTLQVGASLYDGLNPRATGASDMAFVERFYREQRRADGASQSPPAGTLEERLDGRMRDAALRWARENPGRVVQLMAVKFARMWSPWPNAAEMQRWTLGLVLLAGYLPLIALAVWGAARYVPRGWPFVFCVLPAVYFTGLHMIFVSSIRYREPAMLALIVLAAGAAVEIFGRRSGGGSP